MFAQWLIGAIIACSFVAPRHVLIVGDSEACAVGVVASVIAEKNGDSVEVECKPGSKVEHWSDAGNFRAALSRHPTADTVLVFLGTNNFWYREVPNVAPILDAIKDAGLSCVWVGPTSVHGKSWRVNDLLRINTVPTCVYYDTESAGVPLVDGVHPNAAAAKRWLQDVWRMIPLKYEEQDDEQRRTDE